MSNINGDVHSIVTADGQSLFIPDGVLFLLSYGNYGAPPTQFQTRKGYRQTGATELDYSLEPRVVTLTLHRNPACSRQEYWNNRHELHEFLRPNRGGPLVLTLRQPDGAMRSLVVRADPGLELPPQPPDRNHWDVEESVDFLAFDPLWFDPEETVFADASITDTDLVFPITFPIVFGVSGVLFSTGLFTYAGTWETYPTMTLTGPYTRVTITNITTGIAISMNVAILAGEQRIITLTPGNQSIVDANGVNRFSELGPGSNLIDFNIRPNPEVANGQQEIRAEFTDGTGDSAFELAFNTRYFAI